jgi:hypothetical protein
MLPGWGRASRGPSRWWGRWPSSCRCSPAWDACSAESGTDVINLKTVFAKN